MHFDIDDKNYSLIIFYIHNIYKYIYIYLILGLENYI